MHLREYMDEKKHEASTIYKRCDYMLKTLCIPDPEIRLCEVGNRETPRELIPESAPVFGRYWVPLSPPPYRAPAPYLIRDLKDLRIRGGAAILFIFLPFYVWQNYIFFWLRNSKHFTAPQADIKRTTSFFIENVYIFLTIFVFSIPISVPTNFAHPNFQLSRTF